MTVSVRFRIKPELFKGAKRVCDDLGITPTQAVSMTFAQMIKVGGMPFRPTNLPDGDSLVDIKRRNRVLRDLDDSEGWWGLYAGPGL